MSWSEEEILKLAEVFADVNCEYDEDGGAYFSESNMINAYIAGFRKAQEQSRQDILIWLGFWRDKIPADAVTQLQDILGVPK